ncbi:MAG: dTMP kinase [Paracoccaceae bacterium]|nr:dTMP kinase [Paracoccaceae bacterium]
MTRKPGNGLFITFEGIDGCGKSTQARRLATSLRSRGEPVLLTREPGGSTGAEDIRSLLVKGDPDRWWPETELLLFTAARFDHFRKVIGPARAKGTTVICDRFTDSTRVYQGCARGGLRRLVDTLHEQLGISEPDLTILIDLAPEQAMARSLESQPLETRFEDFGVAFQGRMRDAFHQLAREFDDRIHVVNGDLAADSLAQHVEAIVENCRGPSA